MQRPKKNGNETVERLRKRALFQFCLGQAQIIAATVCLFFLLTTGSSRLTLLSGIVALLFLLLSLTFRLTPRRRKD